MDIGRHRWIVLWGEIHPDLLGRVAEAEVTGETKSNQLKSSGKESVGFID